MADQNLNLHIKADGGDASAEEVRKVEKAVAAVSDADREAHQRWLKDHEERVARYAEEAEAIATAAPPAAAATGGTMVPAWIGAAEGVADIGEAAAIAAVPVAEVAEAVADTAEKVEDLTGDDIAQEWLKDLGASAGEARDQAGALMDTLGKLVGGANRFGPYAAVMVAAFRAGWEGAKFLIEKLDEIEAAANRAMPALARSSQMAAVEAAALANETRNTAEAVKDADAAFEQYSQRLRRAAADQAAITDAKLGADLAQIDLDELEGKLSAAEAIRARADARRIAAERKRADEIAAIEKELAARMQQNADALNGWRASLDPARDAQGRLDMLTGAGAMGVGELDAQARAVRDAMRARAMATTTDPAELDALDKAITDAREALAKDYEAMVSDAIKKRDDAVKATKDAAERYNSGRSEEDRLRADLERELSGAGAQQFDAARREADLRTQADLLREEQRRKERDEKAAADAAKARADEEAARLAADIQNMVANAPNAGADVNGLIPVLQQFAGALQNGTNATEMAGLVARLMGVSENLAADQSASRAILNDLLQRFANLEGQFQRRPGR